MSRCVMLCGLLLVAVFLPRLHAQAPAAHKTWKLVWSDEFNGPDNSGVDSAKWTVVTGGDGWGNNEQEYYTGERANLRQERGKLVIEARREPQGGRSYTSARIETRGKFDQRYGKFEARMKLPQGKGLWPAFWMLGDNVQTKGWPGSGEIDIMENIGDPHRVYGTLHGPGYSGSHGIQAHFDLPPGQAADTGFHIYAIEWAPGTVRFLVDDHVYATQTRRNLPAGAVWVYDHPFFLLFDLAVGGYWPGYPEAGLPLPQQMLVDYVRVYRR